MPRKMTLEGPTEHRMAAGFRELLATRRISQKALSEKSGISLSVINRLVAGQDPLADCRKVFAIADALDMEPIDLFRAIGFELEPGQAPAPREECDGLSLDERLAIGIVRALPRHSAARILARDGLIALATLAHFGEQNSHMVKSLIEKVPGYREELDRRRAGGLEATQEDSPGEWAALFLESALDRHEPDRQLAPGPLV